MQKTFCEENKLTSESNVGGGAKKSSTRQQEKREVTPSHLALALHGAIATESSARGGNVEKQRAVECRCSQFPSRR